MSHHLRPHPWKRFKIHPRTPVLAGGTMDDMRRVEKPYSACTLIVQDEKVLSVSRKDAPDCPGIPGGKIEPGEPAVLAAVRELREETSLVAMPKEAVLLYSGPCDGHLCVTYLVARWRGTPRQMGEGLVSWATWEDLTTLSPFSEYNAALKAEYDRFCQAYVGRGLAR